MRKEPPPPPSQKRTHPRRTLPQIPPPPIRRIGRSLLPSWRGMAVRWAAALALSMFSPLSAADTASSGTLDAIGEFSSRYVASRRVQIWLPTQCAQAAQQRRESGKCAVLYMHDGQMLFDAAVTWNNQEWGIDEVAARFIDAGEVKPFIVVGIDNGGPLRHAEYFPQKPFASLPRDQQARLRQYRRDDGRLLFGGSEVLSDNYLKFLVLEVKPYIDKHQWVRTGPEDTFIMGSSMGGLISMYAVSEYPDVFGGAACLSTHWPGGFDLEDAAVPNAFFSYMRRHLPAPATHKLYFDHGTETLDAWYPPLQAQAKKVIQAVGYTPANFILREFPGAAHQESDWQARLHIPLQFLLGAK